MARYLVERAVVAPTQCEWAYLAGLLDGEGSFMITVLGKSLRGIVAISMTDLTTLQWVASRFGGRLYAFDQTRCDKNANTRPIHRLDWTGSAVLPVVTGLLPYLRTKRAAAEVLQQFMLRRREVESTRKRGVQGGRGQALSEETRAEYAAYRARIRQLNVRGVQREVCHSGS